MNKQEQTYLFARIDKIVTDKKTKLREKQQISNTTKFEWIKSGKATLRSDITDAGFWKLLEAYTYPGAAPMSTDEYSERINSIDNYANHLKDVIVLGSVPDVLAALSTFTEKEF